MISFSSSADDVERLRRGFLDGGGWRTLISSSADDVDDVDDVDAEDDAGGAFLRLRACFTALRIILDTSNEKPVLMPPSGRISCPARARPSRFLGPSTISYSVVPW